MFYNTGRDPPTPKLDNIILTPILPSDCPVIVKEVCTRFSLKQNC